MNTTTRSPWPTYLAALLLGMLLALLLLAPARAGDLSTTSEPASPTTACGA